MNKWSMLYLIWLTTQLFSFVAFFTLGWGWLTVGIVSTFLMTVIEVRLVNKGLETLFEIENKKHQKSDKK